MSAVAALIVTFALAGCVPSHGLAIFDREQQSYDMPPPYVDLQDTIYQDTIRYIGEDSLGTKYFAAESNDSQGRGVCLTVVASETDWSTGCSSFTPVKVTMSSGLTATLERDAAGGDEQVEGYVSVELPPS